MNAGHIGLAEQALRAVIDALKESPELRELATELHKLIASSDAPEPDPLLRGSETGIGASTLKRAVRDGRLTARRLGRENFYLASEVRAYVESRKIVRPVPPLGENESEVDRAIRAKRERGKR